MRSDDDLANDVAEGHAAKGVIDNPTFKGAVVSARGKLVNRFIASKEGDSKERDEIWRQLKSMDEFLEVFIDIINSGNIATIDLKNRSTND